jgi:hypothetical protein
VPCHTNEKLSLIERDESGHVVVIKLQSGQYANTSSVLSIFAIHADERRTVTDSRTFSNEAHEVHVSNAQSGCSAKPRPAATLLRRVATGYCARRRVLSKSKIAELREASPPTLLEDSFQTKALLLA